MQVLTSYQLSASSALFNYRTLLFTSCLKEFPSQTWAPHDPPLDHTHDRPYVTAISLFASLPLSLSHRKVDVFNPGNHCLLISENQVDNGNTRELLELNISLQEEGDTVIQDTIQVLCTRSTCTCIANLPNSGSCTGRSFYGVWGTSLHAQTQRYVCSLTYPLYQSIRSISCRMRQHLSEMPWFHHL